MNLAGAAEVLATVGAVERALAGLGRGAGLGDGLAAAQAALAAPPAG